MAFALNNIADIRTKQKKYYEAEKCLLESLKIKEQIFEKDHPTIGIAMMNLGSIYYNLKRLR